MNNSNKFYAQSCIACKRCTMGYCSIEDMKRCPACVQGFTLNPKMCDLGVINCPAIRKQAIMSTNDEQICLRCVADRNCSFDEKCHYCTLAKMSPDFMINLTQKEGKSCGRYSNTNPDALVLPDVPTNKF